MRSCFLPILLSGAIVVGGCNRGDDPGSAVRVEQLETKSKRNHPAVADWEREYEWNREQIAKRHVQLALSPLPDYVTDVWGVGGKPKDDGSRGDWAFVVPRKRIADFEEYLAGLGVPGEFMDTDSPFSKSEREEGWKPPNPPAKSLVFLRSRANKADGDSRGLKFTKGKSRLYVFENPNLRNSNLEIRFDVESGNTHVNEKCIEW